MPHNLPRTAGTPAKPPVYFDANPLSDKSLTGIGRYAARLALAMHAIRDVRFFYNDQVIVPPADMSWDPDQELGAFAANIWRGTKEPIGVAQPGSIAVYPLFRPIERKFDREVTILHDLTPILLPATHKEETRHHFGGLANVAIASADVVITVSESTKADAEWLVKVDPDRLVVAPSGPSMCIGRHHHDRPVERQANACLVVSTLEPRKNPEFLCDWFYNSPELADDAVLWWVGPKGWITNSNDLEVYEKATGTGRRVKFLGYVSDAELCRLYKTAAVTIYPSMYEGFGFPVLDSLRHGTPCLASMNSSIREFDSPGLYFFDPTDKETLDKALARCRADGTDRPIPQEPLDRAYSWNNVAAILLEAAEATEARPAGKIVAA